MPSLPAPASHRTLCWGGCGEQVLPAAACAPPSPREPRLEGRSRAGPGQLRPSGGGTTAVAQEPSQHCLRPARLLGKGGEKWLE